MPKSRPAWSGLVVDKWLPENEIGSRNSSELLELTMEPEPTVKGSGLRFWDARDGHDLSGIWGD
jgi:hypothetical protein